MEKTVEYFLWENFGDAVKSLSYRIAQTEVPFKAVYGIPRGGLPLAVALSHSLNLPLEVDLRGRRDWLCNPRILVVDDICDSGATLKEYARFFTVTLHYVPSAVCKPTFYYKERTADWVVYPWEKREGDTIGKKDH